MADRAQMNINPLLRSLRPSIASVPEVSAEEIAFAISNVFSNQLSPVQTAVLLYNLSLTGLEQRPDVLAACATAMRAAAIPVDGHSLKQAVKARNAGVNGYGGGLCDIVGTGGDHHSTFNISTASSIVASALLLVAKHGNRASTSKSGSADVLACMHVPEQPKLERVIPQRLARLYEKTNFVFLFAPNFHTGLRHVATTRKELPHPTIFNLLGPLTNPADAAVEVRCIGVKRKDLVPVFAQALRINGARKAMVVCGDEDLDEISIAGPTHCARVVDRGSAGDEHSVEIDSFILTPEDFGLPRHPLTSVSPGLTPEENAEIMKRLVTNQLGDDNAILHFVLLNVAALFVVSGVCDGETSALPGDSEPVITETGPGGGRWKEGVRLAKRAIASGTSLAMLERFVEATNT